MNKYLIEILKIQNSVILPGLGALMVPSQKTGKIVFNPHLKFNDGSLARFIAEKEGIDEQESQNKVAKFVREIEAEIGKGNSYDMFEFGRFYKNKDDEFDFDMFKEGETGAATPVAEKKPEKKAAPPVKKKTPPPAEKKEAPKKAEKKPVEKKPAEKKPAEKKPAVKKTTAKKATSKTKETVADKSKSTEETKQSKNKFIPPVVDEAKEDLTKKVESTKEKVADKAKEAKGKIADKAKSAGKGIGAIISDAKDKVGDVKDNVVEKVDKAKEKVEEVKEKITEKSDAKSAITPAVDESKSEDKQSKNKFIPPIGSDAIAKVSDKAKGAAAATVAAGAAVVTGAAAAASSGSKTIVEKTKETTTVVKETVVKEEKKKRRIWPWIIFLLLLAGIAIAGYFFKDQIMAFINGDDNGVIADSTATQDSIADNSTIVPVEFEDTLMNNDNEWADSSGTNSDSMDNSMGDPIDELIDEPIDEPIEDPVDEVAPVVSGTNTGSYHLIGNSFGEKANADRYAQNMQDKGYPAKVLGRFDGLYMVSLKSYDSREAANAGRSSVSADAGSAWVFKYAN